MEDLNVLVVVDMQNDFITGSLANESAQKIVSLLAGAIENNVGHWDRIILTRDTHKDDYLATPEGRKLPVEHCIEGTSGWCVHNDIIAAVRKLQCPYVYINKPTFGYAKWKDEPFFSTINTNTKLNITVVGTCTDICVVSNVLILKAVYPNANITVVEDLCAGLTPEKHRHAIDVMKSCQVNVENWGLK